MGHTTQLEPLPDLRDLTMTPWGKHQPIPKATLPSGFSATHEALSTLSAHAKSTPSLWNSMSSGYVPSQVHGPLHSLCRELDFIPRKYADSPHTARPSHACTPPINRRANTYQSFFRTCAAQLVATYALIGERPGESRRCALRHKRCGVHLWQLRTKVRSRRKLITRFATKLLGWFLSGYRYHIRCEADDDLHNPKLSAHRDIQPGTHQQCQNI